MLVDELHADVRLLHPVPGNPELYVVVTGRALSGVVRGRHRVRVPVRVLLDHPIGLAEGADLDLTYDAGDEAPIATGEEEFQIPVRHVTVGVIRIKAPSRHIAAEMAARAAPTDIEDATRELNVLDDDCDR